MKERNATGGQINRGDVFILSRLDDGGGVGFEAVEDSISGLPGMVNGQEQVIVKSGGVTGIRKDRLDFVSSSDLWEIGVTEVFQTQDVFSENPQTQGPFRVQIQFTKRSI